MISPSKQIRPLAIVAGVACVGAALTILLGPSVFCPSEWTHYHAITVMVVFVTIAFLHLREEAWHSGHKTSAVGFVLLAVVGTSLIVGQSAGRQAEAAGSNLLSVEEINTRILTKHADLAKAKQRFDEANAAADDEMTGQRCGPRCKDWRQRALEVQALIAQTEREIAALGPKKPVNAAAEKIADLFEFVGVPRAKSMAIWALFQPFGLTLLFEFGSVLSFGYAFGRQSSKPAPSAIDFGRLPEPATFSGELPEPPKPRKKKPTPRLPENVVTFAEHPVVKALKDNGGSVASNRELARIMGVCDPEGSKRTQEVEHMLEIERVGKRKIVRLRAAYM